jgi:hypothetical protein
VSPPEEDETVVAIDELDGKTEPLLGAILEELDETEELGGADELDGTTELLLGAMSEELGRADELDETTELLLRARQRLLGEPFITSTHSLIGNGPSRQISSFMQ